MAISSASRDATLSILPTARSPDPSADPQGWATGAVHLGRAFELIGKRFKEAREAAWRQAIGVVGSNRTTNEENYLLQKFARRGFANQ